MSIDTREFRDALGRFASGVCVVTALTQTGRAIGVTISSFCSLSLEPPLVLFCLGKSTSNIKSYINGNYFVVNILSSHQNNISETFASKRKNKFEGISFDILESGCPILSDCLANLECTLNSRHDGGDHFILIGQVYRLRVSPGGTPLLRFRAKYVSLDTAV